MGVGSTLKFFILNEADVEVNDFRGSEKRLSPHRCVTLVTQMAVGGRWSCVAQCLWKL